MNRWNAYSKLYRKISRDIKREQRRAEKLRRIPKKASNITELVQSIEANSQQTRQKLMDIRRQLRRGSLHQIDFDFLTLARMVKNGRDIKDYALTLRRRRAWNSKNPGYYRPNA